MSKKKEKKVEEVAEAVEEVVETSPTPEVMVPEEAGKSEKVEGFEVSDPLDLRPKSLPLVIKPPKGGWANAAQEDFARTLNGYAYKNPEKWVVKRDTLLKQLAKLAKEPAFISTLRGVQEEDRGQVTFNNKLVGNKLADNA